MVSGPGDKECKVAKSGENCFDLNPQTVIVERVLESKILPNSLSRERLLCERQEFLLNYLTADISNSAQILRKSIGLRVRKSEF